MSSNLEFLRKVAIRKKWEFFSHYTEVLAYSYGYERIIDVDEREDRVLIRVVLLLYFVKMDSKVDEVN